MNVTEESVEIVPMTDTYTGDDIFKNMVEALNKIGAIWGKKVNLATDRPPRVIAVLRPVPAQPLTFYKHPLGRENITGYDIMAYSWWRFMNDSDTPPHWLLQFPMVKATVRAMDTVTDYMMKTYRKNITQFTLAGISMGGWATWLTAAVDRRVVAIIPIGMDLLNFTENFHHQFRAYCGWSYMWRPFYEMNITKELDNPRFSVLASHVDPLAYNKRYTNISKYVIIASGDEVSMPDNSHYYFLQLEGEKNLNLMLAHCSKVSSTASTCQAVFSSQSIGWWAGGKRAAPVKAPEWNGIAHEAGSEVGWAYRPSWLTRLHCILHHGDNPARQ
ncbi:autocrine proliferation repressor protein A-like [Eublepharis macularius]|uniref:Autocrine proliferation repressor protein A-like n=1 Tax=Eublepharis macularius TaxID=481883 RepID=A0AA97J3N2_EUBMA|nr:autocrine proliferation repressor protein A-like [Eublepharis macularius]